LKNAQIEIENMTNWLIANKHTFNTEKIKFMLFNSLKQSNNVTCNNLVINGFSIQRFHSIKFLGLHFNENLTWKPHMMALRKILRTSIGVISKLKYYVNTENLVQIYHSLIEVNYNMAFW